MVSPDPQSIDLWKQRAERARVLADRYPASKEILTFYSGLAEWQGTVAPRLHASKDVPDVLPSLLALVGQTGPPALAESARELVAVESAALVREFLASSGSLESHRAFFARAVLQPFTANFPAGLDCPWCTRPPQAGCLRPQGDGLAFELVCGLCLRRRPFPRTQCPGCNESSEAGLSNFTATDFPQLRLLACDTCRGYLQIVDLSRDPAAIPEVDELAGLPLDLWAMERGYHKLQPNLAGI